MTTFNNRQKRILDFFQKTKQGSVSDIAKHFSNTDEEVSIITLKRDLKKFTDASLLKMQGSGRGTHYTLAKDYAFMVPINVEEYFSQPPDNRNVQHLFNFEIFSQLGNVLSDDELTYLNTLQKQYTKNIQKLPKDALKKEFERFTIEFSWKSSAIEGNTYSLLETEQLLKDNKLAPGHTQEEATMILNHKVALDYVRNSATQYREFSIKKVEEIHSLLTKDLNVTKGIRNFLVGITGTLYKPLDNQFQIKEALQKTCTLVNKRKSPFEKTLLLLLIIAYIQPFTDGNKRTSRLCGNAMLLAHNYCPLSYRSADELEYKKAVLLFYEQNNLTYFKQLFIEQFEFAVKNYFG